MKVTCDPTIHVMPFMLLHHTTYTKQRTQHIHTHTHKNSIVFVTPRCATTTVGLKPNQQQQQQQQLRTEIQKFMKISPAAADY